MRRAVWCLSFGCLLACSGNEAPEQPEAPSSTTAKALLAPSIRRLSVAELSAAASALVGSEIDLSPSLPPDARQNDFSRSLTQSVDSTTLKQLDAAAQVVVERLDLASPALPGCARNPVATTVDCETQLLTALATQAFRRAPSETELAELRAVFDAGAEGAGLLEGAQLVVRALLGSPNLLYETSLGPAEANPNGLLADAELGSQLAWLVSGKPPDMQLRDAAARGELRSGSARAAQARRLLQAPTARLLYRRFVEEWLGLNRLRGLAKSSTVAADFPALREALLRETELVIDDALVTTGGSLEQLFAGGYSLVPDELSELYGVQPIGSSQRVSLSKLGRVGLLQHGSFLSTFAHEDESAPVLRGKAVLERLLCRKLPKPAELGIDLVLPPPNPNATTRERFAEHSARPDCAGCHQAIDGIGFAFEDFDAVGRFRSEQAGKPIDTSGHVTLDGQELTLASSVDLSRALAASQELQICAARQLVRFAAGSDAPDVEADFVQQTRVLPASERGSLVGLLLAYVQGDWFARRSTP